MRVLVTGASGFVGGRVCALVGPDDEVVATGRRPAEALRPGGLPPGTTYLQADLADLRGELPGLPWRPDAVVHAAARATPYALRRDYERDNVEATGRIVALCEALGRPRLVHVSSSSVLYRDGDQLGMAEDAPVGPRFANAYARTKAAAEGVVRGYAGSWVVARPRAVFGPGDTVLVPRIVAAARVGRLPLLGGRDTPAVGDLVYVDNLATMLLTLARRPDLTGTYHLCDGAPVELQAVLLEVLERLGVPLPTRTLPIPVALAAGRLLETLWRVGRLRGEPPVTRYGIGVLAWSKTYDPTRMLTDLGRPAVSTAEGIARYVAWQREQR